MSYHFLDALCDRLAVMSPLMIFTGSQDGSRSSSSFSDNHNEFSFIILMIQLTTLGACSFNCPLYYSFNNHKLTTDY